MGQSSSSSAESAVPADAAVSSGVLLSSGAAVSPADHDQPLIDADVGVATGTSTLDQSGRSNQLGGADPDPLAPLAGRVSGAGCVHASRADLVSHGDAWPDGRS